MTTVISVFLALALVCGWIYAIKRIRWNLRWKARFERDYPCILNHWERDE